MKHINLLLVCLVLSACASRGGVPQVPVDMTLKQVTPHVWYVQGVAGIATDNHGFISNSVVIETADQVVVFDALGTPALAKMLLAQIKEKIGKPVTRVYASHYHADHVFGLQAFKEQGAKIYGPEGAQKYIFSEGAENRLNERRKSLAPWVNAETRLLAPDVYIKEDETVTLGGVDIEVKTFGSAHSHADLALYVKQDAVLISGDLIFAGRIPFVGGNEIAHWIAKLDELREIPAKWVIPGHGAAFQDKAQGMSLTRNYLTFLYKGMKGAVDNMLSFDESYKALDWSEFSSLPAFDRANRGNAYRIFLAEEAASLN